MASPSSVQVLSSQDWFIVLVVLPELVLETLHREPPAHTGPVEAAVTPTAAVSIAQTVVETELYRELRELRELRFKRIKRVERVERVKRVERVERVESN